MSQPTGGLYINGIVQATRRLLAIEEHMVLLGLHDPARAVLGRQWQAESDARQALVLAAIRDGVDDDLMRWAIDMQSPENRDLTRALVDTLTAANRIADLTATAT